MAKWDRNTLWRQGQLLTADTAAAFGLNSGGTPEDTAVVVISHDCDLAQLSHAEPEVEVIVGRFVEEPDGNYTHCKNMRCLHVGLSAGTDQRTVELEANQRRSLPKDAAGTASALSNHAPSSSVRMTSRERNTLQMWLAARYRRSAFPDEFDRRLKDETRVSEKLGKAFKITGKYIPAIFFDVDEGEENARQGANDVYELVVTVLYATNEDPAAAKAAAESAANRVSEILRSECLVNGGDEAWQWIRLVSVEVLSDQALTWADSMQLTRWQADHISLKADPPQPLVA